MMNRDEETQVTEDGEVAALFYRAFVAMGAPESAAISMTAQYVMLRAMARASRNPGKEPWQG